MLEYYDKTNTSVYTISLGKLLISIVCKSLKFEFNFKILIFLIVLDPRLKIQYMKDQHWDKRCIELAKKKVLTFFCFFVF